MKNTEKREKKYYPVLLLTLLFAISISSIYAFWAGIVNSPEDASESQEITIGSGQDVNTQIDVSGTLASEGKMLVPSGKAALSVGGVDKNVESFEVSYQVYWKELDTEIIASDDNVKGNLEVTAVPTIIGAENYSDLVHATVEPASAEIVADGEMVEVKLVVTLDEPATKEIYDAIVGKQINMDLSFSVK